MHEKGESRGAGQFLGSCREKRDDTQSALHPIPDFHPNLGGGFEKNIGSRSEFDEADSLAPLHRVSDLFREHDPAGQNPGNLLHDQGVSFSFEGDDVLLVRLGAGGIHGVEEFSGLIVGAANHAGHRRAVDVNIEHTEKNADAFPLLPLDHDGRDIGDFAVGGRDNRARVRGNHPFGIPESTGRTRVVVLTGESHALSRHPGEAGRAAGAWLTEVLADRSVAG